MNKLLKFALLLLVLWVAWGWLTGSSSSSTGGLPLFAGSLTPNQPATSLQPGDLGFTIGPGFGYGVSGADILLGVGGPATVAPSLSGLGGSLSTVGLQDIPFQSGFDPWGAAAAWVCAEFNGYPSGCEPRKKSVL
jgi:hypothetical protein